MEELFFGFFGLIAIILPVYLVVRNTLKIRRLERDILTLSGRVMSLERSQTLAQRGTPEPAVNTDFVPHERAMLMDIETLRGAGNVESIVKDEGGRIKDKSGEKSGEAAKTSREWEAFVGGRLFNRIGAAAIILGIGFFLKYAFDNNLIPEWMRVAMGLITGAGLIVGAMRAHKQSLEIFAQGLLGAGISALYLSVYAAFNFYHLVPLTIAFGGMILVTALGLLLALRFESLAIALIAWFGGFITPLLFHTETPNAVGLFSYLLFLNLGLLALVFMVSVEDSQLLRYLRDCLALVCR
jgi:uncharacterized membrane protein